MIKAVHHKDSLYSIPLQVGYYALSDSSIIQKDQVFEVNFLSITGKAEPVFIDEKDFDRLYAVTFHQSIVAYRFPDYEISIDEHSELCEEKSRLSNLIAKTLDVKESIEAKIKLTTLTTELEELVPVYRELIVGRKINISADPATAYHKDDDILALRKISIDDQFDPNSIQYIFSPRDYSKKLIRELMIAEGFKESNNRFFFDPIGDYFFNIAENIGDSRFRITKKDFINFANYIPELRTTFCRAVLIDDFEVLRALKEEITKKIKNGIRLAINSEKPVESLSRTSISELVTLMTKMKDHLLKVDSKVSTKSELRASQESANAALKVLLAANVQE